MNQIKPDPAWSPEDHLERVYRRGRQLRRRRQFGASSAVVAAVVGLAVMIGGPTSTVLHPLRTITGAVTGGGSDNVTATDETTTTTSASIDAIDPDTGKPTSSGDRSTATTRRSSTPTSAASAASAAMPTSAGPIAGTTPPPTSPIGVCKPGELVWTTATDKSSYRAGDTVTISLHARNASERPCYAPANCGTGLTATVDDANGNRAWQGSASRSSCNAAGAPSAPLLNPHDTYSYGTAGAWDQTVCASGTCARAAVGTYRGTTSRGSTVGTGKTFALR